VPVKNINLDLTTAGSRTVIKSGNRINGVTILTITPGVVFYFKLGNNEEIGPIADLSFLTLTFGGDYEPEDVQEGFEIITKANFPNARLVGFTSSTKVRK
jgi:hypothetical protein